MQECRDEVHITLEIMAVVLHIMTLYSNSHQHCNVMCCVQHAEDGGSIFLQNVGNYNSSDNNNHEYTIIMTLKQKFKVKSPSTIL